MPPTPRVQPVVTVVDEEVPVEVVVVTESRLAIVNPLEVEVNLPFQKLGVKLLSDRQERDDSKTMFVKNLPFKATEDSIWELFGDNVKSVRLPTDRETGRVKGFGYVEFNSIESLDAAVGESWELEGRQLTVDKAGNKPSGMSRETLFALFLLIISN